MKSKILLSALYFILIFSLCVYATGTDDVISHFNQNIDIENYINNENFTVSFDDVEQNFWAKDYIYSLSQKGIISGMGDGKFCPNDKITIKQYIKILTCVTGFLNNDAKSRYSDIDENDWSYLYVSSAYEKGILNIYPQNVLNGDEAITRQDMVCLSVSALKALGMEFDNSFSASFTDNALISPYAVSSVNAFAGLDILSGYDDGSFNPRGTTTRAEASKIIYNILKLVENL